MGAGDTDPSTGPTGDPAPSFRVVSRPARRWIARVCASRSSVRRPTAIERIVPQPLDPAMLDAELQVGVVHVAASGLGGCEPHDPLQAGELHPPGAAMYSRPNVCRSVCGCAC